MVVFAVSSRLWKVVATCRCCRRRVAASVAAVDSVVRDFEQAGVDKVGICESSVQIFTRIGQKYIHLVATFGRGRRLSKHAFENLKYTIDIEEEKKQQHQKKHLHRMLRRVSGRLCRVVCRGRW